MTASGSDAAGAVPQGKAGSKRRSGWVGVQRRPSWIGLFPQRSMTLRAEACRGPDHVLRPCRPHRPGPRAARRLALGIGRPCGAAVGVCRQCDRPRSRPCDQRPHFGGAWTSQEACGERVRIAPAHGRSPPRPRRRAFAARPRLGRNLLGVPFVTAQGSPGRCTPSMARRRRMARYRAERPAVGVRGVDAGGVEGGAGGAFAPTPALPRRRERERQAAASCSIPPHAGEGRGGVTLNPCVCRRCGRRRRRGRAGCSPSR